MDAITELGWSAFAWFYVVGLPIMLIALISLLISSEIKSKRQMKEFEDLYQKCILMHGQKFTKKLYDECRNPWIGIENLLRVFRYHCGVTEKQKGKTGYDY